MIDREKVVKAYEDFVNGYECFCTSDDYEYETHKAVLAMLKEQPQIVRCKDCKYRREIPVLGNIICVDNSVHSPDWFCADGERREGDSG